MDGRAFGELITALFWGAVAAGVAVGAGIVGLLWWLL